MVYIFIKEVAASFCELEQKGNGFGFGNVAVFFEVALKIATGTVLEEEIDVVLGF